MPTYVQSNSVSAGSIITIGQPAIQGSTDSGNASGVFAQNATLSQTATIQSLSFYVINPLGQLVLGIYGDNAGVPGTLLAATAAFTPVAGWNTQPVITPTSLVAGTYWLAYEPSADQLSFLFSQPGSVTFYKDTTAFTGTLPSTFVNNLTGPGSWALYATLSTTNFTSIPIPFLSNNTIGNCIVVCGKAHTVSGTAPSVIVTDTKLNRYNFACGLLHPISLDFHFVYVAFNVGAGANTISISYAPNISAYAIEILEYSGLSANRIDIASISIGTGTSLSSPTITPSAAGALIISYGSTYGGQSLTAFSPWTTRVTSPELQDSVSDTALPIGNVLTPSADKTTIPPASQIVDNNHDAWTVITGQVYKNNILAGISSNVIEVAWVSGVIWQENNANSWYSWNGLTWVAGNNPFNPSPNLATDPPTSPLVDAAGNTWTISASQAFENGVAAGTSSSVVELAWVTSVIWYKNSSNSWFSWDGNTWLPGTNPLVGPERPYDRATSQSDHYSKCQYMDDIWRASN